MSDVEPWAFLKSLTCPGCREPFTDAAIRWGLAQPQTYDKDGPLPLQCERCEAVHEYNLFTRILTPVAPRTV